MTLALLQAGLVEQFATDVHWLIGDRGSVDTSAVEELVTFRLVKNLLHSSLAESKMPASFVQFKVVAHRANESQDVFVSRLMSLESP